EGPLTAVRFDATRTNTLSSPPSPPCRCGELPPSHQLTAYLGQGCPLHNVSSFAHKGRLPAVCVDAPRTNNLCAPQCPLCLCGEVPPSNQMTCIILELQHKPFPIIPQQIQPNIRVLEFIHETQGSFHHTTQHNPHGAAVHADEDVAFVMTRHDMIQRCTDADKDILGTFTTFDGKSSIAFPPFVDEVAIIHIRLGCDPLAFLAAPVDLVEACERLIFDTTAKEVLDRLNSAL